MNEEIKYQLEQLHLEVIDKDDFINAIEEIYWHKLMTIMKWQKFTVNVKEWVIEGINYLRNQRSQSLKSIVILRDGTITN